MRTISPGHETVDTVAASPQSVTGRVNAANKVRKVRAGIKTCKSEMRETETVSYTKHCVIRHIKTWNENVMFDIFNVNNAVICEPVYGPLSPYIFTQHVTVIKACSWCFTLKSGWSIGDRLSDSDIEITELILRPRIKTQRYSDVHFHRSSVNQLFSTLPSKPKLLIDFLSDQQIISCPACPFQYCVFYSLGGSEFFLLSVMA